MSSTKKVHPESGVALVSTLIMIAVMLSLLAAYYQTSSIELASMKYARNNTSGFYAAEAGLNMRAEAIRQVFVGFNVPSGNSPLDSSPCTASNQGSGDFSCRPFALNKRSVKTWIAGSANPPVTITIPRGEKYQNLSATEYTYTAKAETSNSNNDIEADLELQFKSRLVPLFQFAAFYNKDLEILPSPTMTIAGPVHTNRDLYLMSAGASLTINGQVTAAGRIYRGRKDGASVCTNNPVQIFDPNTARSLIPSCPSRTLVTPPDALPFNQMVQFGVSPVSVPGPELFSPASGSLYWDRADLRLVLALDASGNPISVQVRNQDNSINASATATINSCAGVASGGKSVGTTQIFNFRENAQIRLLDVDVRGVLDCLRTSNWFSTGKLLNDTSDGGLVFHLTVNGPRSNLKPSLYAVRLRNAASLQSTAGSPVVKGLTVVSDQPAYIMGNYNSVVKIPAAVMADAINELSSSWNDANSAAAIGSRIAGDTTFNAAFLAGTDTTGNTEGVGGQGGAYNGGLENYPRFHENWSGKNNIYRGSLVSLSNSLKTNGRWGSQSYSPPNRDWNFDTSFNNPVNLPPLTPRFVYLRQELFVHDFDRSN